MAELRRRRCDTKTRGWNCLGRRQKVEGTESWVLEIRTLLLLGERGLHGFLRSFGSLGVGCRREIDG